MITAFILPGLYNSGSTHWQSRWEAQFADCVRVVQTDWDTPRCSDWVGALYWQLLSHGEPAVLVAHSTSCIMVAHLVSALRAAEHPPLKDDLALIRGALLVAPSDPDGPAYPAGPSGFSPVPLEPFPFPSIVVASTNDAYVSLETAQQYAEHWGSEFVNLGARGHINGDSGLGDWPEGYALLQRLRA